MSENRCPPAGSSPSASRMDIHCVHSRSYRNGVLKPGYMTFDVARRGGIGRQFAVPERSALSATLPPMACLPLSGPSACARTCRAWRGTLRQSRRVPGERLPIAATLSSSVPAGRRRVRRRDPAFSDAETWPGSERRVPSCDPAASPGGHPCLPGPRGGGSCRRFTAP